MQRINFDKVIKDDCSLVNQKLIDLLPEGNSGQGNVVKAMKYSLVNGGKRIRPVLVIEFCKMLGGSVNDAIDFAAAIEYIHTYSLIHDDLPCMDDDDMRRNNPSCHKMYGESTALLAGDALLTQAFKIIADADISDDKKIDAMSLLAQNAGVDGMIGGQVIDIKFENEEPSLSDILTIHKLKTGALIAAACILGCIAAGGSKEDIMTASKFAYYLGVAFQIKDDILDVTGDEAKLGKPVGSDSENDKTTYVTIVGIEKAQADVERLTNMAKDCLNKYEDNEILLTLSDYLISREQ